MKISEYTLINLTKAICGNAEYMPYMRGADIVHLFNKFGFNEVYGQASHQDGNTPKKNCEKLMIQIN